MLIDIATEELSPLEVIGTIVAMLNKGAKGRLAEGTDSEAETYRNISGGGPALTGPAPFFFAGLVTCRNAAPGGRARLRRPARRPAGDGQSRSVSSSASPASAPCPFDSRARAGR